MAAPSDVHARLVRLLQNAHAGELAAFHAYEGHRLSVRDPAERMDLARIQLEELEHRECVGAILRRLGAAPRPSRERGMALIGRAIGLLCRIGGWLVPMYGAGLLERGNIVEYDVAARLAAEAGYPEPIPSLEAMAYVEWEHEAYFRAKVRSHRLSRFIPHWSVPPARIRPAVRLEPPAARA